MVNQVTDPEPEIQAFVVAHGLAHADEPVRWHPLTGGVSSDIWQVELPGRSICVKRARATLKVEAEWRAPVSRNAYEWAWMQFAVRHCPENVPRPLAHDPEAGLFAMAFLAPEEHPVWKQQLMAGEVSVNTARAVGQLVGCLHAASAGCSELAGAFDTAINFHALRLEPYLIATAAHHPEIAPKLLQLAERTSNMRVALVHGDVSPKNILVGPHGPILLDAECAWFGDPAFDLAFCLSHLLLKWLVRPERRGELIEAYGALATAYLEQVTWEMRSNLEERAAHLIPALLLARVDGRSPAEYLTQEHQRADVRMRALPLLHRPVECLSLVAEAYAG
jgi:5-methylthioribose kinase